MNVAKIRLFSDLIEKNRRVFKVPIYQRHYDWTTAQCEALYSDIMLAQQEDKNHFTGTIVYMQLNYGSALDEVLIIDGQQRITTLYILLKALWDVAKGKNSLRVADEIKETILNRNCDPEYELKLKAINSDHAELEHLFNNKLDSMDRNSNIYKNYTLFKKLIEKSLNHNDDLNDILYGIKKLHAVEIMLDKDDNPQQIFESINSTGLPLSLADLIRNYLLMDKSQEALYKKYWTEIEKYVGYDKLQDFVVNFLNVRVRYPIGPKTGYGLFKDYCKGKSKEQVLRKLAQSAKYYGACVGTFEGRRLFSSKVQYFLSAFRSISQTTVIPFLLRVLKDFDNNHISEDELCKLLKYLLTYYIRITVCEKGKSVGNLMQHMHRKAIGHNFNHYYQKIVNFLSTIESINRMPSDNEFKEALMYKPLYAKPACKFILASIENTSKETIDITTLTIEHLLPQHKTAEWRNALGNDYDEIHDAYLHTLGNLTLTGYNSELGTRTFDEKKKIIKENSKSNILNADILNAEHWNEKSITTRAENLANKIVVLFPDVPKDESINQEQLNAQSYAICEWQDCATSNPSNFSFYGQAVEVHSWSEVLDVFLSELIKQRKDELNELAKLNYALSNETQTLLTSDERTLEKAKELGDSGIFYETQLQNKEIILFIKNLISSLNLEEEEFKVYLQ